MSNIIHLSHTDVFVDYRIKKAASALADQGYFVHVVGFSKIHQSNREGRVHFIVGRDPRLFLSAMPRFFGIRALFMVSFFQIFATFFFIKQCVRIRPTIIHCHDNFVLPSAVLCRFVFRTKLVYEAHELEHDKNGQSSTARTLVYLVERWTAPFWDAFITVNEAILSYYKEVFNLMIPARAIYNTPTWSNGKSPSSLAEGKEGAADTRKRFVYIGYLSRGRGIEIILQVFERFKGADLTFIGSGELEELVAGYAEQSEHISWVPMLPHDELHNALSQFDYGLCMIPNVSLSDHLALPNKYIEYVSAGLFVVSTDGPEMHRLNERYKLGVSVEFNFYSLDACIRQLSQKKYEALPLPSELHWERQVEKLRSLYDEVFRVQ